MASDTFYGFLRQFFDEKKGDLSGFWLSGTGSATALFFTFQVAVEADEAAWRAYAALRNGRSPVALGAAWLAPSSAVLQAGEQATAQVMRRNALAVASFSMLFPAV